MDGLRWLLLVFGVIVIVGVYFYTRAQKQRADANQGSEQHLNGRIEPSFEAGSGGSEPVSESTEAPKITATDPMAGDDHDRRSADLSADSSAIESVPQQEKIVTLRVVARGDDTFAGDELILSMRGIGMRHGRFGIFHRLDGSDEDKVIFSAASLVEPGSFDMQNLKEQKIPGISLFMVLPGPMDGAQAFDLMMAAARTLAQSMDAELLDETGSTLSIQRERYLREEIIQYEHSPVSA